MADHPAPGVLVVDDQPDIRALLQTVLRHYGFNVWLAPGGPQAVELYRLNRERIALALLDVAMPEWDGPRTLQELKAINPELACCFITGAQPDRTEPELLALGAAHVIRKPFELAELARVLWGLVGAGAGDRRSAPRYPKQATRVAVGEGLEPSQVVESWISDLSPDGLRLRLPAKLGEVGAILSIRPTDAGDDVPWVAVQMRYCRPEGDGWTVGCRFIHPSAVRVPEFQS